MCWCLGHCSQVAVKWIQQYNKVPNYTYSKSRVKLSLLLRYPNLQQEWTCLQPGAKQVLTSDYDSGTWSDFIFCNSHYYILLRLNVLHNRQHAAVSDAVSWHPLKCQLHMCRSPLTVLQIIWQLMFKSATRDMVAGWPTPSFRTEHCKQRWKKSVRLHLFRFLVVASRSQLDTSLRTTLINHFLLHWASSGQVRVFSSAILIKWQCVTLSWTNAGHKN